MAKIAILSHDKLVEYLAIIERYHPAIPDVWGTMDGIDVKFMEHLIVSPSKVSTIAGNKIILILLFFVLLEMEKFPHVTTAC